MGNDRPRLRSRDSGRLWPKAHCRPHHNKCNNITCCLLVINRAVPRRKHYCGVGKTLASILGPFVSENYLLLPAIKSTGGRYKLTSWHMAPSSFERWSTLAERVSSDISQAASGTDDPIALQIMTFSLERVMDWRGIRPVSCWAWKEWA